jgi:serine/threonine protein kinase
MGTVFATLVDALRQYRLLEPQQLQQLTREFRGSPDPKTIARELLRRGWLTAYQANQLMQDRAADLLLGSYVLLERLGEGGMGQVFKARNWKLGQIVALKIIRPERMASVEPLRRFHREMRLAAQLQHPNIVRALDADQVGSTHMLAMEYVEGIDLARLVKQSGPLPVRQACDYVRQAALGLQYAYEQGMVHRDIKPSNLLVTYTAGGTLANTPLTAHQVKILDLGVARLEDSSQAETVTSMTVMGCIVGTPDFMSPEQARDSHSADIRSDLYSLGCTLYYLLSGQVPFPGGTGTEKLLQHHMEEPRPLEQLRPDVPAAVAAVVRKLMAKRPEDRYQTPAEAAAALSAAFAGGIAAITGRIPIPAVLRGGSSTRKIPVLTRRPAWRRWPIVAAVALVLLGGSAALWALRPRSKPAVNPSLAQVKEEPPRTSPSSKSNPPEERVDNPPRESLVVLGEGKSQGAVYAVVVGGQVLASGGGDNAVHVWDTGSWRERAVLRGHAGEIRALAITADGKTIASGSADQAIKLWDVASATSFATLKGHTGTIRALAFSPDGRTLASGADKDAQVRIWDVSGRTERSVLTGHEGGVHALTFAPNGSLLSAGADRLLRLWDLEAGGDGIVFKGHTSDVLSLAYASDGKRIASGTSGGVLRLWNPATQSNRRVKGGPRGSITGLAFSPDGKRLVSAGIRGSVVLWDVDAESKLQEWPSTTAVNCVALGPRGQYVAAGTQAGTIQIFRMDASK